MLSNAWVRDLKTTFLGRAKKYLGTTVVKYSQSISIIMSLIPTGWINTYCDVIYYVMYILMLFTH